jgi:hypothetical protein
MDESLRHGIVRRAGQRSGSAHLYLFPFDIYAASGIRPIFTTWADGVHYRIYWPFRSNEQGAVPVEQVHLPSVPFPPGTRPPAQNAPQLHNVRRTERWEGVEAVAANALRVDMYPRANPAIGNRLVVLLRWPLSAKLE